MKNTKSCVLTIAGSDSSGGAGIQADIKAISATGCYAASVITTLTAQNTLGVQAIHPVSANFVEQQLESVLSDLIIKTVKIGMLFDEKIMSVVAMSLRRYHLKTIVLDPVMIAKNGCVLMSENTMVSMQEKLFPHVTLITPNLVEASHLLSIHISTPEEQEAAAIRLGERYQVNVLLKGGHFNGQESSDVIYIYADKSCDWFHAERIHSKNTHGTGCTLSAAIASYLAQDVPLRAAVRMAKNYLTQAIKAGVSLEVGKECGPVDHFFR